MTVADHRTTTFVARSVLILRLNRLNVNKERYLDAHSKNCWILIQPVDGATLRVNHSS
jgi:hypothetical protein